MVIKWLKQLVLNVIHTIFVLYSQFGHILRGNLRYFISIFARLTYQKCDKKSYPFNLLIKKNIWNKSIILLGFMKDQIKNWTIFSHFSSKLLSKLCQNIFVIIINTYNLINKIFLPFIVGWILMMVLKGKESLGQNLVTHVSRNKAKFPCWRWNNIFCVNKVKILMLFFVFFYDDFFIGKKKRVNKYFFEPYEMMKLMGFNV